MLAIILTVLCLVPAGGYANAAEPPALVVIMNNAPEDAVVSLVSKQGLAVASKSRVAWETYYVLYHRDIGTSDDITLRVSGNSVRYEQPVGKQYLSGYPSIITLDFAAQTIAEGKLLSRSILLVGMRLVLTLAIESLVLFLFGFREKRSWIVFLLINLLTQGLLNISLNGISPLAGSLLLNLILLEFWVFAAETAGVLAFIREHSRLRRVAFVLTANLLSLVLGGYLITVLPV